MSERKCLQCGEPQAAVRESQKRGDPLFCAEVDYFGEVTWELDQHRFSDWTDKELIMYWRVKPEAVDNYRHITSGYEIADEDRLDTPRHG